MRNAIQHRAFPWIWLSIIALVGVIIAWYAASLNNYAITPDFSGLACAVNYLAIDGTFSTYENPPFGFEMCWKPSTYTGLQLLHAGLLMLIPIPVTTLLLFTIGGAYVGLICILALISWKITKSQVVTIATAAFTMVCPAVLRSLVLTPQNLFGYLFISFGLLLAIYLLHSTTKKQYALFGVLAATWLGVFATIHTLSFGIALISFTLWFGLIYIKQWYYKVGAVVLIAAAILGDLTFRYLPISVENAWNLISSNNFPGFYHPLWDHPAIWGYLITALGALGIVYYNQYAQPKYSKIIWLFLCIGAVPLIIGHLPVAGISLLPNRFIPFAWIPLVLGAGVAVKVITDNVTAMPWLTSIGLALVITAQGAHGIVFINDDINGLSFRYRPTDTFVEALQWLEDNDADAHLLGIQSATDQAILMAPQWFRGQTTYYPWFALNHRNVKKFKVVNESSPYSEIINQPNHPEHQRLSRMYTVVTKPQADDVEAAIETLNIDYLLVRKDAQPYTEIWEKDAKNTGYPVAFENDLYVLYTLR